MGDEQKTLDIILKYGLDQSSIQQTNSGLSATTSILSNQEQQLRRNRMELRELSQVFTAIGLAGAAVYVPAIAASQEYIKAAGQNEALSKQWLADTTEIKQATIDVGRVVTEGLLPGYTQVANIVSQFSKFSQENPKLIQAAVGLAGGLVTIAAAGKVFTEVDRAVVDIQLIASGGMNSAAKIQAGAAATMLTAAKIQAGGAIEGAGGSTITGAIGGASLMTTLAPIVAAVGGILLGTAGYNALKPANAPSALQIFPELAAIETNWMSQNWWPHMGSLGQGIEKFAKSIDSWALTLTGAPNPWKFTGTTNGAVGTSGGMSQADYNTGLTEFTSYQQSIAATQKSYHDAMKTENASYYQSATQAENTYLEQRTQEEAAHNQEDLQALQDYQDNVAKETRDFNEQQAQDLANFQQQQSDAIANFQASELQAQQTYQNQMADLEQSHKDKLQDLTQSHDVLGIEKENRDYSEQKAKDQRDYSEADAQRRTQLAKTLADNQRNYDEQTAQRLASFQQQQSDELDNYNKSKQRRDDAFAEQQASEATQHEKELDTIEQNHKDKITQLKQNLSDELNTEQTAWLQQYYTLIGVVTAAETQTAAAYNAFLQSMGISGNQSYYNPYTNISPTAPVLRDEGGYFFPGVARNATGKPEWVVAPDTVRYAEQIVGGRLTQQNLIAAMIGGRSGGAASSSYVDSRSVNVSGLTAQDRLVVRDLVNRGVREWAMTEFKK
jgi:hypothetical protein